LEPGVTSKGAGAGAEESATTIDSSRFYIKSNPASFLSNDQVTLTWHSSSATPTSLPEIIPNVSMSSFIITDF